MCCADRHCHVVFGKRPAEGEFACDNVAVDVVLSRREWNFGGVADELTFFRLGIVVFLPNVVERRPSDGDRVPAEEENVRAAGSHGLGQSDSPPQDANHVRGRTDKLPALPRHGLRRLHPGG